MGSATKSKICLIGSNQLQLQIFTLHAWMAMTTEMQKAWIKRKRERESNRERKREVVWVCRVYVFDPYHDVSIKPYGCDVFMECIIPYLKIITTLTKWNWWRITNDGFLWWLKKDKKIEVTVQVHFLQLAHTVWTFQTHKRGVNTFFFHRQPW